MFCSLGCDWAAAERPPDDPDRQDRRQKDGREIDEQLMHVLPPGCGIPEMDGRVKGEKRCADHCRGRAAGDVANHASAAPQRA
jgi:hypothetical protein